MTHTALFPPQNSLLYSHGLATYFGNLAATPIGVYWNYELMRDYLQADAASVVYEEVLTRINKTALALGLLLACPVGTSGLTFQITPVVDHRRRILIGVQGCDPVYCNATIHVLLDSITGELYRSVCVDIHQHDES